MGNGEDARATNFRLTLTSFTIDRKRGCCALHCRRTHSFAGVLSFHLRLNPLETGETWLTNEE